jgi:hypothetical protein
MTEIHHESRPAPDGVSTANITWYGTTSFGPSFTTNVSVGPDAGSWMSKADAQAAAVGTNSGAPGAASIPAPMHTAVNGTEAIVYTDSAGWTSVTWSPRPDLLLAVTGLHATYDQVLALAKSSELQS